MTGKTVRQSQKGFTLMELLVVLGIFSMVVTAASDIFMLTGRSQRRVFGLERTQADARFVMEALTREIRTGRIDYEYYAEREVRQGTIFGAPETELALVDSTDTPIRFFLSDDDTASDCAADSAPCLLVSVDGGPASAITPKGVSVSTLAFYISPLSDPTEFDIGTGTFLTNEQPRVTIVLSLDSMAGRTDEQAHLVLQTTVTNRRYDR